MTRIDDQSALECQIDEPQISVQVLWQWLPSQGIGVKFHSHEQSLASHVGDERKPARQSLKLAPQHLAHGGRVLDQAKAVDLSKHGNARCASDRVAAICVPMQEAAHLKNRPDDLLRRGKRAERRIAG